jgi:hypothetical protein
VLLGWARGARGAGRRNALVAAMADALEEEVSRLRGGGPASDSPARLSGLSPARWATPVAPGRAVAAELGRRLDGASQQRTCPVSTDTSPASTEGGTRRVQLLREGGGGLDDASAALLARAGESEWLQGVEPQRAGAVGAGADPAGGAAAPQACVQLVRRDVRDVSTLYGREACASAPTEAGPTVPADAGRVAALEAEVAALEAARAEAEAAAARMRGHRSTLQKQVPAQAPPIPRPACPRPGSAEVRDEPLHIILIYS